MRVWILAATLIGTAACERPNLEMTGGGYGSRATAGHPASAADTAHPDAAPPDAAPPDTTAPDH